jgi:hypothetical protein
MMWKVILNSIIKLCDIIGDWLFKLPEGYELDMSNILHHLCNKYKFKVGNTFKIMEVRSIYGTNPIHESNVVYHEVIITERYTEMIKIIYDHSIHQTSTKRMIHPKLSDKNGRKRKRTVYVDIMEIK